MKRKSSARPQSVFVHRPDFRRWPPAAKLHMAAILESWSKELLGAVQQEVPTEQIPQPNQLN